MNTPGRTVSGWWDCRNNALYLERLVHQGKAEPKADAVVETAAPALGLLWRPVSLPKFRRRKTFSSEI